MNDYINQIEEAEKLLDFINRTPNSFYAVKNIKEKLLSKGFIELSENAEWEINKNKGYFTIKNNAAIIAFRTGDGDIQENGFRIIGAHGDSPCFKIKPKHMMESGGYCKLNTECYGGPILSTWLDRPLAISGRIVLKDEKSASIYEKLIDINKPLFLIPNLAIHMNREANDGYKYNKQIDMLPLAGYVNNELENNDKLISFICAEEKMNRDDIIDFDLLLYPYEKGELVGIERNLISCARLDDLWMVYAGVEALIAAGESDATQVFCCFDAEEVGSVTSEGAASDLLANVLERICLCFGKNREQFLISINRSICISADLAHAVHPNLATKADPINRPILGQGPVIKYSANQRYATNAITSAAFRRACDQAQVPYQVFANRSDTIGGSTIGPITSARLGIRVVDMGSAILSMHSARETGDIADNIYTIKAFISFYEMNE